VSDEQRLDSTGRDAARVVRITVTGDLAAVEPSCRWILEPALHVSRRVYRAGGPRGFVGLACGARFYTVDQRGRGLIPAGLVARAAACLESQGHPVTVVDRAPRNPRLVVDPAAAESMAVPDRELADAVAGRARGQIVYGRTADCAAALAAIVRVSPRARVTIVTAGVGEAKVIRGQLSRQAAEAVGLYARGGHRADDRLRVGTFRSADPGLGDLVLVADVTRALGSRAVDFLTAVRARGLFGFVPEGTVMSRREGLRLESIFGPVVRRIGRPGGGPRDVRVLIAESPVFNPQAGAIGLRWKRDAVWHDAARNERIAALAVALEIGDEDVLRRHGARLRSQYGVAPDERSPRRVVVLVESPEHGRELVGRLPGWRLLSGPANGRQRHGAEGGDFGSEAAVHGWEHARSVMTLLHANSVRRLDIDVLVRADGTPWPLRLAGFPPARRAGDADPVLLVDLADEEDGRPGHALSERLRDYADRDWPIEGPGRILNSLTNRPTFDD